MTYCKDGQCQLCDGCAQRRRVQAVQRASDRDALALRIILFVVMLACAMVALSAKASDDRPLAMQVDGRPGVWFPLPEARLILEHERERQGLLDRVHLMTDALALADTELRLLRSARGLSTATTATLRAQLERAQADAREAHEWYRDPVLWGGAGLVVGAVLVTVIALAVGGDL